MTALLSEPVQKTSAGPPTNVLPRKRTNSPWLLYGFLTLTAATVVLPLYLIVLNSLKSTSGASVVTLRLPPALHFANYVDVLRSGILRAMGSTLLIAGSATLVVLALASSAAYVLARRDTWAAKIIRSLMAIGLLAPLQIIPEIKIIQVLGLEGTYWGVILIHSATWLPFSVFMYSGFIRGLPTELEEAAEIDGCRPLRVFFSVMFPLLRPVTLTLAVLLFTGVWNDFQISLYFITNQNMYTMPLTLFNFSGLHTADYNLVCADIVMTLLPIIVVFLFAQRYIVAGLTQGATKG
jgi:raffinose/stachyose/melibiose transport system permease protein